MSQKKLHVTQTVTTCVAHNCDACGKEQASDWKLPAGWVKIVDFPGYSDWDPETYHACSAQCFVDLAFALKPSTDKTKWECETDNLRNLTLPETAT